MKCTWKECDKEASVSQLDNNGVEWANLCQEHHDEIENRLFKEPFNPKKLLGAWIKAQGGSKLAVERLINGIP